MASITITDSDVGTAIANGDGTRAELALIDAGQSEPWSLFALVDGNGYASTSPTHSASFRSMTRSG